MSYPEETHLPQTEPNRPPRPSSGKWTLPPDQIHLWCWQVSSTPLQPEALATLNSRERQRAERFRVELHRSRWVRAHTGMRQILAGYLNCNPAEVAWRRGQHGKPQLEGTSGLRFNLSHSEDWCALAVARHIEVGVDIQVPHRINPRLWKRVLTPHEQEEMARIPAEAQDAAFFRCWTRKEAVGKADSRGVYAQLKRTETGLKPPEADLEMDWLVMTDNGHGTMTPWHVRDLLLPANLFGAIAASTSAPVELRETQQAGLNLD